MLRSVALLALAAALAAACSTAKGAAAPMVRARAATDLDCPDVPFEMTGRALMDDGLRIEAPARPAAAIVMYQGAGS